MHAYGARASHACRSHWGQEPKSRSADIWNPRRVKQYIEISESKYEMPARSRSHLTKKLWPVSYNFELRFCWSHISGTYLGANGQQILVGHVCRISGACLDGNGHRILMLYPCMYVSDSDMWVMYLYHACIYTDKNLRYSRRSLFLFFWPLVALCHIGFCIQDFAIYSIGLFGPIYFFCEHVSLALSEQIADHPRSRGCVYGKFLFVYM